MTVGNSVRTWRLYQGELGEYQESNQAQRVQTTAGQESGNPHAEWRGEKAGNPNRNGQGNSAGHRTGDKPHV